MNVWTNESTLDCVPSQVNMGPVLYRRDKFMELGMFNNKMSCVGDAGIGFDFEFSIRAWKFNTRVGIYYSKYVSLLMWVHTEKAC